jgi:hypothetical protein
MWFRLVTLAVRAIAIIATAKSGNGTSETGAAEIASDESDEVSEAAMMDANSKAN